MNSCIIQFHLSAEVLGYSYSSKNVKNLLIDYKLQENAENKRIMLIIQQGNQQGFFSSSPSQWLQINGVFSGQS